MAKRKLDSRTASAKAHLRWDRDAEERERLQARARAMKMAGGSLREIGRACGVSSATIATWTEGVEKGVRPSAGRAARRAVKMLDREARPFREMADAGDREAVRVWAELSAARFNLLGVMEEERERDRRRLLGAALSSGIRPLGGGRVN